METIDTIITNWTALSNTPIDWSLNGGMIWLTGMMIGLAFLTIRWTVQEAREDRRVARQALYRHAEYVGFTRSLDKSFTGFSESPWGE